MIHVKFHQVRTALRLLMRIGEPSDASRLSDWDKSLKVFGYIGLMRLMGLLRLVG